MEIVTTGQAGTGGYGNEAAREQLILATNNGLFHSTATQTAAALGSIAVANRAAMGWTAFLGSPGIMFNSLHAPQSRLRHTVNAVGVADDGTGFYERSRIYQVTCSGNATNGNTVAFSAGFLPADFNALPSGTTATFPQANRFFSDGGVRFLTIRGDSDPSSIMSINQSPFNTTRWCGTDPESKDVGGALTDTDRISWVCRTGDNGAFMVGTNNGVRALQ